MKRVFWAWLCVAACSSESIETRSSALSEASENRVERAEKAKTAAPHGPYLEPADWRAVAAAARGNETVFSEPEREKLTEIRVPVLAPRDSVWLEGAIIVHQEHWYTISARREDVTFYIKGSTLGFRTEMEVPHPIRDDVTISRSHGIVTASFRRFETSYHLDVECTSPQRDPRCADDDTVRRLVADLVVYGGAP